MRTVIAAVAGLAAVVLCLVAVPALWLDHQVVQEEGFVALTAPLAEDQQMRSALADAAAEEVLQDADFAPGLAALVRPLVEQAAQSLTEHPNYSQAWTEALRSSHRLTFADSSPAGVDSALVLDIAPLIVLATADAAAAVGADIPVPDQVPVEVGAAGQQQKVELIKHYAGLGAGFAVAGAAAFVLAVAVARRRSTTVALVGAGVLVCAGVWKLAADLAARQLLAAGESNALAAAFLQYFVNAAQRDLDYWILAGAGAGGVLVLVGLVSRLFAGSQN